MRSDLSFKNIPIFSITFFVMMNVCFLTGGCVVWTRTRGTPLDSGKLALIKPGVTTFSEILNWLGPPYYIIDGNQSIQEGYYTKIRFPGDNTVYQTRTFKSSNEMVILVYINKIDKNAIKKRSVPSNIMGVIEQNKVRYDELFIYISKKDRTVMAMITEDSQE